MASSISAIFAFLKRSLLAKTLIMVGTASAVVASLFILVTLEITQQRAQEHAITRLNELIDSTGVMAGVACFANDATLAAETAQAFVKNSEVLTVIIRAGDHDHELARATRSGAKPIEKTGAQFAPLSRPVYSPFDNTTRVGEIQVTPNWEKIEATVAEDVRYAGSILVLVTFGIVGVIATVVTFLVVRPVKAISDSLHAMDASLGESLLVPTRHATNELGRLVGDINDLVLRLRDSLLQEHESHLQQVISEKLRLAAEVFKHSQEGIMITDSNNLIVTVNQAFSQITGYTEDEVVGKSPRMLSSGRQNKEFYSELWSTLLAKGHWKGEIWNRRKDGEIIPKWFSINTVRDQSNQVVNYVAIFSDISERKHAEEKIDFLAYHDALTNLPNRVLLRDRFAHAKAAAIRDHSGIAMMFVDLDNFKRINDSFGHQVGDQLLIQVVERIRGLVRQTDTICRQGGDEFIVLLPDMLDPQVATRITQDILDAISAPLSLGGHTVSVSASVGIALFPSDGDDFDTLMKSADAAMYDAKASGKNAYRFFTELMNTDAVAKLRLQADLRTALQNNEFKLYYQPQMDIGSGQIAGMEALIRWQHPEFGMVSPAKFIPLAEECGLIVPIGEWVLGEATRQGRRWLDANFPPFIIAVNISALQFNRGDIYESVRQSISQSGFPPHLLELELTESALLHDVDQTLQTIKRLQQLGVKFSIDDFGTGYSSLSYLKQLKVDKLKIDQSFVRDIGSDADDLGIVRAIIQLGKTLQLTVIAEGVETAEQLDILKLYGCDEVQGYYHSAPKPPLQLEAFLKNPVPAA